MCFTYLEDFPLAYEHPAEQWIEYCIHSLADVLDHHHFAVADPTLDAIQVVTLCQSHHDQRFTEFLFYPLYSLSVCKKK